MTSLTGEFKNRFLQASDNGIGYDCEFIVGSENVVIEGHKFMFSVASEVFKAMFYGELKENHAIKIKDLDADGFKGMKHFIYTGEVKFTSALEALSTYIAARKYLVSELTKECSKYIQKNIKPSEVLEFYEYCETNNIPEFEELSLKIIEEKTNEVVVNSEYIPTAKIETIQLILKSRSLNLNSEIEVFDLFEKWALAEAARKQISEGELATSFVNLKKYIRLLTISSAEYSSRIEPSLLFTEAEKRALECNLLQMNSKPMPETLSLIQQQRNFLSKLTTFEEYKNCKMFVVAIDSICQGCSETVSGQSVTVDDKIIYFYYKLSVVKIGGEYLCCKIQPTENSIIYTERIFKLQSKVSVLAENECDDLTIISECKILLKPANQQYEVSFAEIPMIELNDSRVLRNKRGTRVLMIKVQFNVIKFIG